MTMQTKTNELTAKLAALVVAKMAAGASYLDAFNAAASELSALVDSVCAGGKSATRRMVAIVADVRALATESL